MGSICRLSARIRAAQAAWRRTTTVGSQVSFVPAERITRRPEPLAGRESIRLLATLVFASVGLQLINAVLVKLASASPPPAPLLIGGLLGGVLVLSFARFLIWNGIYRRYPISLAYPLSASFFPAVVLVAWAMGETIGLQQLVGAMIVMLGVVRVITPEPGRSEEPPLPVID